MPPAGMDVLQAGFRTVTCAPDWLNTPPQPLVTFWLPANVQVRVQFDTAAEPLLLTVTFAVNPLPQSFVA